MGGLGGEDKDDLVRVLITLGEATDETNWFLERIRNRVALHARTRQGVSASFLVAIGMCAAVAITFGGASAEFKSKVEEHLKKFLARTATEPIPGAPSA